MLRSPSKSIGMLLFLGERREWLQFLHGRREDAAVPILLKGTAAILITYFQAISESVINM